VRRAARTDKKERARGRIKKKKKKQFTLNLLQQTRGTVESMLKRTLQQKRVNEATKSLGNVLRNLNDWEEEVNDFVRVTQVTQELYTEILVACFIEILSRSEESWLEIGVPESFWGSTVVDLAYRLKNRNFELYVHMPNYKEEWVAVLPGPLPNGWNIKTIAVQPVAPQVKEKTKKEDVRGSRLAELKKELLELVQDDTSGSPAKRKREEGAQQTTVPDAENTEVYDMLQLIESRQKRAK